MCSDGSSTTHETVLRDFATQPPNMSDTESFPPLPGSQAVSSSQLSQQAICLQTDQTMAAVAADSRSDSRSFAQVADFSKGFSAAIQSLEHKPEVKPVFLGFKE